MLSRKVVVSLLINIVILLYTGSLMSFQQSIQPADMVLYNGKIYTVNKAQPWAQAIAIKGNKIVYVGSDFRVRDYVGDKTKVINLKGNFTLPGFNDAHVHFDNTGALLVGVNLLDVHEAGKFAERIKEAAQRLPKGEWITRGDWGAYELWDAADTGKEKKQIRERFIPDRNMIDKYTPDHPVLINRFDREYYLANSLALKLAGIDENVEDEDFVRDSSGKLTGLMKADAAAKIRKAIPPSSFERLLVEAKAALKEARENGVTTIQDISSGRETRVLHELYKRGELTSRIMLRPYIEDWDHVKVLGITEGFGNNMLKFIGMKGYVDGIMGNSSALFFEPYSNDPNNYGILRRDMFPEGNMEKCIRGCVEIGLSPHVHAIGDKGNRILLDIYEKVISDLNLKDHRFRIIHAQVISSEDFPRLGKLNLICEVNPYHVSDDMRWMEERIGHERCKNAYAFRSMIDNGALLCFGTDSPGTNAARYPMAPLTMIYAAVSRKTVDGQPAGGWFPEQKVTMEEAIEGTTINSAYAAFEEDIKGSIEPGKLADIIVLDKNLFEIDHSEILKTNILYTIMDGNVVFKR